MPIGDLSYLRSSCTSPPSSPDHHTPQKVTIVFEFSRVVICGACSSPTAESQPRGNVIRVSFDRRTHQLGGASDGWAMQFCEVSDGTPPKSNCLRR
jgi:hypothetical protein